MKKPPKIKIKQKEDPIPPKAPAPVANQLKNEKIVVKPKKRQSLKIKPTSFSSQSLFRNWKKYSIISIPVLLLFLAIWFFSDFNKKSEITAINGTPDSQKLLYGIDTSAYAPNEDVTSQDFSVAAFIQQTSKFTPRDISEKIAFEANQLGIKNIKAAKDYTVFSQIGKEEKIDFIVYEPSVLEYILFKLSLPIEVKRVKREITKEQKIVSGIIKNSLPKAIMDSGEDIPLNMLTEIEKALGSVIDLFAVSPSDKFKLIYEQMFADNVPIDTGQLKAMHFLHEGTSYYAFRFEDTESPGFYDENARATARTFLSSPLKYGVLTSRYDLNRLHPIKKRILPHLGTDYGAPEGTPIYSVSDGVIELVAQKANNGNYIKIKHDDVYGSQYLHMQKFAPRMKKGLKVKQGEIIGYVGQTGSATGPHVCFRFWKHGEQVDPLLENLTNRSLSQEELETYKNHRDSLMQLLEY